jgi:fructose-1,6-bisphosphatase/inositol monophosphatase family enzyme
MDVIEKGKMLNEKQKELEDMKIKQEFDHHIVSEKDKEIEKLIINKKQL